MSNVKGLHVRPRWAKWGWLCLVAGVLGAASGIFLIVVVPAVADDHFSYPFAPGGFTAIQLFFFIQHLGLLAGLYGLWQSGAAGSRLVGKLGTWGAIVSMALLTVTELIAIAGARSAYPSPRTDTIEGLYGITSMLIGATLVIAGIPVIRAGLWRGWRRYLPLALGVYVFVPLTPALFGSFTLGRIGIGVWMLGFAVLGWALITTARDAAASSGTQHLNTSGGLHA